MFSEHPRIERGIVARNTCLGQPDARCRHYLMDLMDGTERAQGLIEGG
jgi:hypothetical protein